MFKISKPKRGKRSGKNGLRGFAVSDRGIYAFSWSIPILILLYAVYMWWFEFSSLSVEARFAGVLVLLGISIALIHKMFEQRKKEKD